MHVSATTGGAQIVNASHLGGETDASGAVDATSHDGFHQRSDVLVLDGPAITSRISYITMIIGFDRPLAAVADVSESAAVAAKGHALILQVALTALIANGAIKGMVDQQELHHSLPGLAGHV